MKRQLSIIILLAQIASLSACGSENVQQNETTSAQNSTETTIPAETLDVPELDNGGKIFTILACNEDVRYTYIEDVDQTGDAMDDAIYLRNRKVEKHLGISLKIVDTSTETARTDIYTPLSRDVMSGDAQYDMISPHILQSISQLVTENMVVDLSHINYVDFTKSWWNGDFYRYVESQRQTDSNASGDMIVPNAACHSSSTS